MTARAAGVVVTMALERAVTRPGENIGIEMRVANLGAESVVWRSGGCDLEAAIAVLPAVAAGEAGPALIAAPAGGPRAAIEVALAEAEEPAPPLTLALERESRQASCTLDHGFSLFQPGDRLVLRAVWASAMVTGAPASPGAYVVSAAFPMLRSDAPIVPAQFKADRHLRSIAVVALLTVAPAGGLSASQAVARMLVDPRFAGWLAARAGDDAAARLSLHDGRWVLRVMLADGPVVIVELAAQGLGQPDVRVEEHLP